MSLNYQLQNIKDYQTVTTDPNDPKKLNPVTYTLIWAMVAIGMDEITEKNHLAVFKRLFIYEKIFGGFMRTMDGGYVCFKLADIKLHIGLETNVTKITEAAFDKRVMFRVTEDAVNEVKRQEREL